MKIRRGVLNIGVVVLLACGCRSTPENGAATQPAEIPAYRALAEAHNARIAQLEKMYADGVIEIRWKDEKGRHFEQGNMELWLGLPRLTALRVEKLGEVLLWLGSDRERYWLFDMVNKQTVLHVGRHDESQDSTSTGALSVKPLALLDLMALSPLPISDDHPPAVVFDQRHEAWVIKSSGGGGPMRLFIDRRTLLPSRVETLSESGAVALYSELQRYKSVALPGMLPIALPKVPHLIDIAAVHDHDAATTSPDATSGEVKIVIGEATGEIDEAMMGRIFDLDRLITSMPPDRIEGELPEKAPSSALRP